MLHLFKPAELTDHTEDPKTQAILFSAAFDVIRGIIDSPLLKNETKNALIMTAANYFIDNYVKKGTGAPGSVMVDLEEIEKTFASAPTPIIPVPEPIDPAVIEFSKTMDELVVKNKGRKMSKTLLGKSKMEELVNLIDGYIGTNKVMLDIKAKMNRTGKETTEEKSIIIADFVRSIV